MEYVDKILIEREREERKSKFDICQNNEKIFLILPSFSLDLANSHFHITYCELLKAENTYDGDDDD